MPTIGLILIDKNDQGQELVFNAYGSIHECFEYIIDSLADFYSMAELNDMLVKIQLNKYREYRLFSVDGRNLHQFSCQGIGQIDKFGLFIYEGENDFDRLIQAILWCKPVRYIKRENK